MKSDEIFTRARAVGERNGWAERVPILWPGGDVLHLWRGPHLGPNARGIYIYSRDGEVDQLVATAGSGIDQVEWELPVTWESIEKYLEAS